MKREDLKAMGLADELIDKIMAENGKDIEKHKGEAVQKAAELTAANTKISELTGAVQKFDGVDIEKLRGEVAGWQTKYDADMQKLQMEHALSDALRESHTVDSVSTMANLDTSIIKLDGGKLLGLDEQLTRLKSEKPFLFKDTAENKDTTPRLQTGASHGSALGSDPLEAFVSSARVAAGLKNNDKGDQ